jgi:hypothetical protein
MPLDEALSRDVVTLGLRHPGNRDAYPGGDSGTDERGDAKPDPVFGKVAIALHNFT